MKLKQMQKNNVILALMLAVILITIATGVTFAYLTYIAQNEGGGTVGSIEVGIYNNNGNTLISGYEQDEQYILGAPILVTLGGTLNSPTNVDLWVKNTGTINGIVRVFISINFTQEGDENLEALTETLATMVNTGWVNDFSDTLSPVGQRVFHLHAYYNSQVAPNTPVRVINSISPKLAAALNAGLEIQVRADMVAYSGNAYQLEDAGSTVNDIDKPFGNLSTAFLQSWTAWE